MCFVFVLLLFKSWGREFNYILCFVVVTPSLQVQWDAKPFTIDIVLVQSPASKIISLAVQGSDNIDNVKGQIQALEGISPNEQRILKESKQLDEGKLSYHRVEKGTILRMVSPSLFLVCLKTNLLGLTLFVYMLFLF